MPEACSPRAALSPDAMCLGRDWGDDIIFAEADGHPAVLQRITVPSIRYVRFAGS